MQHAARRGRGPLAAGRLGGRGQRCGRRRRRRARRGECHRWPPLRHGHVHSLQRETHDPVPYHLRLQPLESRVPTLSLAPLTSRNQEQQGHTITFRPGAGAAPAWRLRPAVPTSPRARPWTSSARQVRAGDPEVAAEAGAGGGPCTPGGGEPAVASRAQPTRALLQPMARSLGCPRRRAPRPPSQAASGARHTPASMRPSRRAAAARRRTRSA